MISKPGTRLVLLAAIFAVAATAMAQNAPPSPEEQKRADMRIPELDRSAFEPEKRAPTDVPTGERNPFGLLALPQPEEEQEVKVEVETEEMKIRRVLGNMRVTGLSGQPGSYRVMIGSMSLAKGDTVPRLFANQAEVLRVEEISDRQVVLNFVESRQQQDQPPRSIGLAVDLSPMVRSVLPGEVFTNLVKFDKKGAPDLEPMKTEAVDSMMKAFEKGQLTEAFVEHPRALLGESYVPPGGAKPTNAPAD